MSRSLIVLPDDSPQPILDAITSAKKTLRVKMFVFSDPVLVNAVVGARRRGVNVRVMLNPARRNGEDDNAGSRKHLIRSGVEVIDTNPAFDLTHEKSMVVDDRVTALVRLHVEVSAAVWRHSHLSPRAHLWLHARLFRRHKVLSLFLSGRRGSSRRSVAQLCAESPVARAALPNEQGECQLPEVGSELPALEARARERDV